MNAQQRASTVSWKSRSIRGCRPTFTRYPGACSVSPRTNKAAQRQGWRLRVGSMNRPPLAKAGLATATVECPTRHEQRPTQSPHVAPFPGGPSWPPSGKVITLEPYDHEQHFVSTGTDTYSRSELAIPVPLHLCQLHRPRRGTFPLTSQMRLLLASGNHTHPTSLLLFGLRGKNDSLQSVEN